MHTSGWIELLRLVPPEMHDGLVILMQNALEFNIQQILRLEEQFMVCRGRMVGSTDSGLVLLLPYDQMTCVAHTKSVREEYINSWFGGREPFYDINAGAPSLTAPAEAPPLEEAPAPEPEPAPAPVAAAPAPAAPPKPLPPSRPGLAPAPARPAAARPAPAAGAPLAAPGAAAPAPGGATVPLSAGMALPAKAAMIERLRKRTGPPPGAPEQK